MPSIGLAARGIAIAGVLLFLGGKAAVAEEKPAGAAAAAAAVAPAGAISEQAGAKGAAPAGCCQAMRDAGAAKRAALDEKLAAVDRAKGEAKVEAMAALLRELVAEHGAAGCCGSGACPGGPGCAAMAAGSKAMPDCCAAMAAGHPAEPADCPMMRGAGNSKARRGMVRHGAASPEEKADEHGGHDASD